MKIFWILFCVWLFILVVGDSESDIHAYIRDATFVLFMFIGLAVYAIDRRIDRARRQIQEPDFDVRAENRQEWFQVGEIALVVVMIFVVATLAQGFFRCVESDDKVTLGCIWEGTKEQIADDLD